MGPTPAKPVTEAPCTTSSHPSNQEVQSVAQALRLPRRGGQGSDDGAIVLGHRGELAWTSPSPATITVASRSVRHTRAVPPSRRITLSMASMRWAWSIDSANTPRMRPECGSVPSST